jgi:hypothetical protein
MYQINLKQTIQEYIQVVQAESGSYQIFAGIQFKL